MKEIFYTLQGIISRAAFYETHPWECLRALHRVEGDIIQYMATLKQMETVKDQDTRPVFLHPPKNRPQPMTQTAPPPTATPVPPTHPYNFVQDQKNTPVFARPNNTPISDPPPSPPRVPLTKKETPPPSTPSPSVVDLNDELRAQIPPSLSDFLHTSPIQDLKLSINLNDRFQFIADLFRGDEAAFDNAVHVLNKATTQQEAHHYLKDLMHTYQWHTLPREQVEAFVQLVNRRFS